MVSNNIFFTIFPILSLWCLNLCFDHIRHNNKIITTHSFPRIDVDKLQDVNKEQRICVRSVINTYEAYRITFKETTPDTEGTKENCRGNDDT